MPTAETITLRDARLEIDADGIAVFSHQRPERRNPLSPELRLDYVDLLDRIERDPGVRALVITGSGGAFCAGGDLKSMKERLANPDDPEAGADGTRRRLLALHAWVARLRNLERPVIAAVDGPAIGAGMALALLADFVLASDRASFSMSFAKVGLLPDMAAGYLLPRAVGLPMAKELVMTARRVDVDEARRLGIVHAVHPADELLPRAREFARRFLAAPREAVGLAKRLLNASYETPYGAYAELESNAQAVVTTTPYHAQAVQRFLRGEAALFDWEATGRR